MPKAQSCCRASPGPMSQGQGSPQLPPLSRTPSIFRGSFSTQYFKQKYIFNTQLKQVPQITRPPLNIIFRKKKSWNVLTWSIYLLLKLSVCFFTEFLVPQSNGCGCAAQAAGTAKAVSYAVASWPSSTKHGIKRDWGMWSWAEFTLWLRCLFVYSLIHAALGWRRSEAITCRSSLKNISQLKRIKSIGSRK